MIYIIYIITIRDFKLFYIIIYIYKKKEEKIQKKILPKFHYMVLSLYIL